MQRFSLTKTATTLGISLGLIVGSASQILAFTFNLNRSFDGGTAIGTITTDQLGTLNSTNITNWSIQISRGADTRLLTENDSVLDVGDLPPTIFATATELTITPATEAELISAGATASRLGFIDGGFSGRTISL